MQKTVHSNFNISNSCWIKISWHHFVTIPGLTPCKRLGCMHLSDSYNETFPFCHLQFFAVHSLNFNIPMMIMITTGMERGRMFMFVFLLLLQTTISVLYKIIALLEHLERKLKYMLWNGYLCLIYISFF